MSQSQVPEVVRRYLATRPGGTDPHHHPTIAQTFHPDRGWKRYPGRKRISASWARKLRAEGVTYVALTLDEVGRTGDFSTKELAR